jgi:CDP-diacylglycerol--glycerol-3-phosphate 3-phosphatidyltransferase
MAGPDDLAAPPAPSAPPPRKGRRKKKPKLSREEKKLRRLSLRQEFLNLPNYITMARTLMIPLFSYWIYEGDPMDSMLAAITFAMAGGMDALDGFLARKLNKVTTVGKFMDPLADKLMVMSALVLLVRLGRAPSWAVILLLAREFIVTGLRTIAAGEGLVIAASQGGKWKTGLQLAGLSGLIIHYEYPMNFLFGTWPVDFHRAGLVMLYASLVPSVTSAIGYFQGFLDEVTKRETAMKGPAA